MTFTKFKLSLISIMILFTANIFGQNVRGFYLTNIGSWLGNTASENNILSYAQGNGFNYILLYDLGAVNWTSTTEKNQLASFISRAHTQYGISEVGAVVEVYSFVTSYIKPYQNGRPKKEKFDVINQEFEFWLTSSINNSYCHKYLTPNGYGCDTASAWRFSWKQFQLIDSFCAANAMISEVYLGWPNQGQMQHLASRADRILLHSYRPDDSDVYSYSRNRLMDISGTNNVTKVLPLFSSEPAFMGGWLNSHAVNRPYQTYENDFANETASFAQNIDLQGYTWFHYSLMPHTILGTASSISANGPLSFCSGGNVTLTASAGLAYLWSPGGETTQSIVASTPGSYQVRVTDNLGLAIISPPTVVSFSNTGTVPAVTASGSISFCPGGSVTLTSDSSSSYLWSNGATTQSIIVSASGNYQVTTAGGGSCAATSLPVTVNAAAPPDVPTISASGSLQICTGSMLVLTSTQANTYLWSTGETTRSIIVSSAGNYFVTASDGPACTALSDTSIVTINPAPSAPSINVTGSLNLTVSNPSVILTSSIADSYLWTNGETTNSITVTSQGSYRVRAISANGCSAVSNAVSVHANGCIPPPSPVITLNNSNILGLGQSITLTSSQGNGYLWSTGDTTQSITVSAAGSYSVNVYAGSGCYSSSLPVQIYTTQNPILSVIPIGNAAENGFNIYPNPAREEINIVFNAPASNNISFRLIDVTGRVIQSININAIAGQNNMLLNVSAFPRGIYFGCLFSGGEIRMFRVILE